MNINELAENIARIITESDSKIIAIDGRCASGKTTLSKRLQTIIPCNVIHMDHFFLRPEQRTAERLSTAGENVDYERFLSEVLIPMKNGENISYRPFNCKTMTFSDSIKLENKKINIIEGSYSCHNALFDYYDLRIFLSVSRNEQMRRIIMRDGPKKARIFETTWIPLEENYFSAFNIRDKCDYSYNT